jgi:hypothetical protein
VKEYFRKSKSFKRQIFLSLLILIIGTGSNYLFSQNSQVKPTRQSSFEAYSKGNYELAYKEFAELLLTYSKDPLYKYYSGVCLIKLNRKPDEAAKLLNEALQSSGGIKTLPSDLLFYLGRACQMSGQFPSAIRSYNLYSEQVGKKVSRDLGIPEFIQQCNEMRGVLPEPVAQLPATPKTEKALLPSESDSSIAKTINLPIPKKDTLRLNIPPGYENTLGEAIGFQYKADSLSSTANDQKKEMGKLQNPEKTALKVLVAETEKLASAYQDSADLKYREALDSINHMSGKMPEKPLIKQAEFTSGNDTIKKSKNKPVADSSNLSVNKTVPEAPKQFDSKVAKKDTIRIDTIKKVASPIKSTVETFTLFEVLPKPISTSNERIIIDPDVPAGLIYRIQMAVFRNPVPSGYFMGITPVYGFRLPGTDKTNYYAGMFRRSLDAKKALISVKAKGFKDAFIVAFLDNKLISADRAVIMEKEWGKKPFRAAVNTLTETPLDTVPPTLTFRVEVMRSVLPAKNEIVEGIEKMAGSRKLEIQNLEDGNIVYMIGNFITFESAEDYAGLLNRNGYREAKVVAWLGRKEIPVETARQLFEDMK